jgi:hypothetical protein
MERRLAFLADSLIKAGRDSAQINGAVRQLKTTPGRGGGGGGGVPPVGNAFSERPGETPPQPQATGGRAGGPGGGGGFNNELFTELRNLLRLPGGRASLFNFGGLGIPGGGFGGPQPQPVAAGEYTVVVTIGSKTLTRKVRVERSSDLN